MYNAVQTRYKQVVGTGKKIPCIQVLPISELHHMKIPVDHGDHTSRKNRDSPDF